MHPITNIFQNGPFYISVLCKTPSQLLCNLEFFFPDSPDLCTVPAPLSTPQSLGITLKYLISIASPHCPDSGCISPLKLPTHLSIPNR